MQFLLYCLCGGIGVSTDYAVYYAALKFGAWYQAANVFGYVSGTVVSFFLNRKITFGVRDKMAHRLAMFLGVAAIGFSVSALMLWLLVDFVSVDAKIAKLFTLPVVVILQFSLNRRVTFRESTLNHSF
jgi:putative flippase GtrA